jgi:DNA-binding CsgD family transcriptional regulator
VFERSHVGVPGDVLPLREVLDGDLDRGIALFDAELGLVYANPAARAYLHPPDGAVVAGLREAVAKYRDRLGRSSAAQPPAELTIGTEAGRRARATISLLARTSGGWFVVRLSAPGTFTEPNVRRLQSRFRLTLREAQVAMCVARGQANGEIAAALGIREKTVKNALMSVFLKCQVRNRVELALKAHDAPIGDED